MLFSLWKVSLFGCRPGLKTCAKSKNIVPEAQNKPWRSGSPSQFFGPEPLGHHLSDYFGTPFAKIRLSCNSLKNLY